MREEERERERKEKEGEGEGERYLSEQIKTKNSLRETETERLSRY